MSEQENDTKERVLRMAQEAKKVQEANETKRLAPWANNILVCRTDSWHIVRLEDLDEFLTGCGVYDWCLKGSMLLVRMTSDDTRLCEIDAYQGMPAEAENNTWTLEFEFGDAMIDMYMQRAEDAYNDAEETEND